MTVEGALVDARLTGRHGARRRRRRQPAATPAGDALAPCAGWMPRTTLRSRTSRPQALRAAPSSPATTSATRAQFSGLDMLTVLTIDLDKGLFASTATRSWPARRPSTPRREPLRRLAALRPSVGQRPTRCRRDARTQIHRFDASGPGETTYRASGEVRGYLLNQFSLSEYDGALRVARPRSRSGGAGETAAERELRHRARRARRQARRSARPRRRAGQGRAHLRRALHRRRGLRRDVPPGRPALHARPRASRPIRGARRAEDPRLLGLPAPGRRRTCCSASARTPPRRAARPARSSRCSTSPTCAAPARLHARRSADSSSEAEYDQHAFLYWEPANLAVIPLPIYGRPGQTSLARSASGSARRASPRWGGSRTRARAAATRRRSVARWSSATCSTRCPTRAWHPTASTRLRRSRSRRSRRRRPDAGSDRSRCRLPGRGAAVHSADGDPGVTDVVRLPDARPCSRCRSPLVTGPANAEKARVVLDGYRAALQRGEGPILVVPTFADVERYRAELASGGVVFGAQVVRFGWLSTRPRGAAACAAARSARSRASGSPRPPSRRTPLRALRASAATPRLRARAAAPRRRARGAARDAAAPDAGAAGVGRASDRAARAYADEVAALYAAYRRLLERLGRLDAPLLAPPRSTRCARTPPRWGATPVFFYGFDDLTPLQRDAVETLARRGADGHALAGLRARPHGLRRPRDDVRRPDRRGRRATEPLEAARRALRAAARERAAPSRARPVRARRRPALRSRPRRSRRRDHAAAGRRRARRARARGRRGRAAVAEEGVAPEEIAVVLRAPGRRRAAAGARSSAPSACRSRCDGASRSATRRSGAGSSRCCAARCRTGRAEDLLAYLRTPGLLQRPSSPTRWRRERAARARARADAARALWEAEHWPLDAIDRVRAAPRAARGAELLRAARRRARGRCSPRRAGAPREVLDRAPRRRTPRCSAGRAALDQLAALAALDRGARARSRRARRAAARARGRRRHAARARACDRHRPARAARAPRPRAVRLRPAGGRLPRAARPEPFFGDAERERDRAPPPACGCAARDDARRRALPLLRDGLAARGAPVPVLARRPATTASRRVPLVLRRRRLRPVRPELRRAPRTRALGAVGWPAARGADRARAAARRGRRRPAPARGADRAAARRRGSARAARPPGVVGLGDRAVGGLPGEVVRRAPAAARGPDARPRADAPRRARPRACSRRRCAALVERPARRACARDAARARARARRQALERLAARPRRSMSRDPGRQRALRAPPARRPAALPRARRRTRGSALVPAR